MGVRGFHPARNLRRTHCRATYVNYTDETQGVYGAVFSRLNFLWSKSVRQGTWVKRHPIVEVLFVSPMQRR